MATPLLSIRDAYVTFGGKPVFTSISLHIASGEKIALVGCNGAGKSTLMDVITGKRELDSGERWVAPRLTIGHLPQVTLFSEGQTVGDYVLEGLPESEQGEHKQYIADIVLAPLYLHRNDKMDILSGGQLRRASLARSLIAEPDLLLLDEPTNHLDLDAIEWLENYVSSYKGALLCISHDRTFLKNISRKIFWLDRGALRTHNKGYSHFDEWQTEALEQEQRELHNLGKEVDRENHWAHRGVTARRKRNERRLSELHALRDKLKADRSSYNQTMRTIKLDPLSPVLASKMIVEFKEVSKEFQEGEKTVPILKQFSLRLLRGDRLGIIGKNGSGKSTFLKLLMKEMVPDTGHIRLGKSLDITYFDQNRSEIDPDSTLWETLCPDGGDTVMVGGKPRHVVGYLRDFLFDPKLAKHKVSTLSGGQANRLLLAKKLANPGGVLILDEPTNDLDMDTLDMLQEILGNFPGTLIIVSHDRDFLDRTVTKLLAFEGEGKVETCIGGYSDYLENKKEKSLENQKKAEESKKSEEVVTPLRNSNNKLSYKYKHELATLPGKIAALEAEINQLEDNLADPGLYTRDPKRFDASTVRLEEARNELDTAETRWLELEEMRAASE